MEGGTEGGSSGGPGSGTGPQPNNPAPNSKEKTANPPAPEEGLTPELSGTPEKTDTDPKNATGPEPANALLADAKVEGPHKALENLAAGSLIDAGTGAETADKNSPPVGSSSTPPANANQGKLANREGTYKVDGVLAAEMEKPIIGTPAEGLDLDPRYQGIKKELEQKWAQEHPGKDFLSDEGQDYHLGYIDPKDRHLPTLKSDTDKLFRERYPADAQSYDIKEKTRIYDSPSSDPAIRQVDEDILKATKLDSQVQNANSARGIDSFGNVWDRVHARESIHRWDSFIDQYPEKAKAYADKGYVELQRAFAGRERVKQYREQQQRAEAVKPKTLDNDATFRAFMDDTGTGLNARVWAGVPRSESLTGNEYHEKAKVIRAQMEQEFAAQHPDVWAKYRAETPIPAKQGSKKRFTFSKEPFAQERIAGIKTAIDTIKAEHPEVLSFSMFGSMTKGTATERSDIDGYLFVDADMAASKHQSPNVVEEQQRDDEGFHSRETYLQNPIQSEYESMIRDRLKSTLGLTDEQVEHIRIRPISQKIIDARVQEMNEWATQRISRDKARNERNKEIDAYLDGGGHIWDSNMPQELSFPPLDYFSPSSNLTEMFHLQVGKGLEQYKAYLIGKLSNMGEAGERIWHEIMSSTRMMEVSKRNTRGNTGIRFPKTLEEARRVYGSTPNRASSLPS